MFHSYPGSVGNDTNYARVSRDTWKMSILTEHLESALAGHGAVTQPKPRQAIDGSIAPWNGSVPAYPIPFTGPNWCALPASAELWPQNWKQCTPAVRQGPGVTQDVTEAAVRMHWAIPWLQTYSGMIHQRNAHDGLLVWVCFT